MSLAEVSSFRGREAEPGIQAASGFPLATKGSPLGVQSPIAARTPLPQGVSRLFMSRLEFVADQERARLEAAFSGVPLK